MARHLLRPATKSVHAAAIWSKMRHHDEPYLERALRRSEGVRDDGPRTGVNPSLGRAAVSRIEVRLPGGLRLPGRVWSRDGARAMIAFVHGMGEHSGRYAALASDLVQAGFTVAALDLPGHGEAGGGRGDASWAVLRDQVIPATFTAWHGLPGQPASLPAVLLGHSMGGALALDYALTHPTTLAAVVASGPALRWSMPPWWKLALANVARVSAPGVGFPNGIDETAISRDPEVIRLRREDPLKHNLVSPRLYFDFNEARQRVLRGARRLQVPALVLQGGADRVVDPQGAAEFVAAAPPGMARLVTCPDAYHEIFNDLGRAACVAEGVGWLGTVLRT